MRQTFEINWKHGYDKYQQEAIWFNGVGLVGVATLTTENGETYTLDIYCDGETLARIPRSEEDLTDLVSVRYDQEWREFGVTNDTELIELSNKWAKRGVEIWDFNSWFDLYTEINGVSQHLDAVCHTQDEAEAQAEAVLQEVAELGGWKQYFNQH
jgi:hypothetical protein